MMYRIIPAFALLFSLQSHAQTNLPVDASGKVAFTGVVAAEGMDKGQLYANAKKFFQTNYKSSKTIKEEERDAGTLAGQSFLGFDIEGKVQYDISISVKDGRYKYVLTNFTHKNFSKGKCAGAGLERDKPRCASGGKMAPKTWSEIKTRAKQETDALIEKLKEAMQQKTATAPGEDW